MACPCGVGSSLEACCGPYLEGERVPETAETLMRSRYTAYTLESIDYVVDTHDPKRRNEIDREGAAKWSKEAEWLGLEILNAERGGASDEDGSVEFIARYRMGEGDYAHHERAHFRKDDGRWYFVDGDLVKPKPVVREHPKVGRNEPCPCGSGRKFKKCCGVV